MRKTALFMAIILLLGLFCGCSGDSADKLAYLEEQVGLLQDRVTALEAENDLLMQMVQQSVPEVGGPEVLPTVDMTLYDWAWDGRLLTVSGAFVRVMSLGTNTVTSCQLRLYRNDALVDYIPLSLLPGEADDSLELEVEPVFFDLTGIESEDVVTLDLEIMLDSGEFLCIPAGSWEYQDSELMMVAG